jgi:hypothetical protein
MIIGTVCPRLTSSAWELEAAHARHVEVADHTGRPIVAIGGEEGGRRRRASACASRPLRARNGGNRAPLRHRRRRARCPRQPPRF